ncbi:unnamed protein product [Euphydryas editha]|uniref:Uncharacterized protein n=1 Tax=Euphydryas editha TaxID=104508 RepID=A0AAU9UPG8_EUPED|nr:unnamed protein product [Euphydryas editha]
MGSSTYIGFVVLAIIVIIIFVVVNFTTQKKKEASNTNTDTFNVLKTATFRANRSTNDNFNYKIEDDRPFLCIVYLNDANAYDLENAISKSTMSQSPIIYVLRMLYYRNPYEFQNEETVHIRDLTLDKTQLLTVGNIYYNCDKHLSLRDTIVLNPDLNTDIYFTNQDTTLVNDPSQKSLAFVQSLINYQDYCNNWNSDIRMQLVDNTKKRTILAMLTSNTRPLSVEDLTNKSLPTSLATVDWN